MRRGPGWVVLVGLVAVGCLHRRDLRDPWDRPVTHSAYTMRGVQAEASVGGSNSADLAARLGVTVGLGKRLQADVNAAHLALGVANAGFRVALFERGPAALAFDARVLGTSPRFMWYLPADLRDDLGGLGLITAPLGVHGTFRLSRRIALGLGAGYEHSAVGGAFDNEAVVLDGSIGARRLWVRPTAHVVLGRVLLEGAMFVPYGAWGVTAIDATAELQPGVRAGVTSYEWAPVPSLVGTTWQVAAEFRWGATRLRAGVTGSPAAQELGLPLLPNVGVRIRSGGGRRKERS